MKVVILAGGKGTRISEESYLRPKPMIEIGGKPILWHIMKLYSFYGFHEFIICCGYKGQMIKEYFIHYYVNQSDCRFNLSDSSVSIMERHTEPWKITLANTGLNTLTAGRVLKIREYLGDDDEFMLTYGDGVSNVNIHELLDFHHRNGSTLTITATQPQGRFGSLRFDRDDVRVRGFREKNRDDSIWVNTGFMVANKSFLSYLGDGETMLETEPFQKLADAGKMAAFRHEGFWAPMDTLRDKEELESMWQSGKAPWKIW